MAQGLPITHDPVHADMPHEVTVIKGRRSPTCRHCKGITFQLTHAAKHVSAFRRGSGCGRVGAQALAGGASYESIDNRQSGQFAKVGQATAFANW